MQWYKSYARDFLDLFSLFLSKKVTINETVIFRDYMSGIRLKDWSKLAKNKKNDNDVTDSRHNLIDIFTVVVFL